MNEKRLSRTVTDKSEKHQLALCLRHVADLIERCESLEMKRCYFEGGFDRLPLINGVSRQCPKGNFTFEANLVLSKVAFDSAGEKKT